MDKDYNNLVTPNEFIKVFLEADEILRAKIENAKVFIRDYKNQRMEAINKLDGIRGKESLNRYGIMEESVLNINIIEAQGLRTLSRSNKNQIFCLVNCEGKNIQKTKFGHPINPVWNDEFLL